MATFRKSGGELDRPVSFGGSLQDQHKFQGVINLTGAIDVSIPDEDISPFLIKARTGYPNRPGILFVSSSSHIGLSTETPRYTLDVNGNFAVKNNAYFEGNVFHSGNVGIGVSDPIHPLEVAGLVHLSQPTTGAITAPSAGDGGLLYHNDAGNLYWHVNGKDAINLTHAEAAGSSSYVQFNTNGNLDAAEHLRFNKSAGYLGVGTFASINDITHRITLPNIDSPGGQVKAAGFVSYSSKRYKKNIKTFESPVDTIKSLRGVRFDWKETGSGSFGFIAEEVGKVLPEIVTWEDNGEDAQSMDYSKLTAILVEAIKQQQKTIDDMKEEIQKLKNKKIFFS